MRTFTLFGAILSLAALPMVGHAEDGEWASVKLGTLGLGAEFGGSFNPNWAARVDVNGFDYNYHHVVNQIDYTGKLKLASFGAQIDYSFTDGSPFYLTAGLYANNNKINASAAPTSTTTIGIIPYTPAEIGTLSGHGQYGSSAPYLGLGWRWPLGPVLIHLEAGAYFQGKAHVTLTSDGTLAGNAAYQAQLATERQDLQNDMNKLSTYPVAEVGLGYRF